MPGPKGPGLLRALVEWWGERPLTQLAIFAIVGLGFALLGSNLVHNMARVGLTPGFGFLGHAANFEIGEGLIAYSAGDSYLRAIAVGLLNTVRVSLAGCILATILGVALGIARLSSNPLLSRLVQAYVEIVRNTPLLLQIFFWNTLFHALPGPRQALSPLPGVLLSNRGFFFPFIADDGATPAIPASSLLLAVLLGVALKWRARRTGRSNLKRSVVLVLVAALLPVAVAAFFGAAPALDLPRLSGFNIRGGISLSPEFMALLIALVVNTSASIAETVRAGILSVSAGQWEAGRALGLSYGRIMRLIVLPQALRLIIPVMTSSYLSLTKNSSLAVAIGFPDLVNILNTTANTTGQALEAILVMMLAYLALSLAVSTAMNAYNRRWALRERSAA
ncbi:amino acid ABC transporter permease [Bosea sp. Tri-49]|uniref:amino acid ABC transporter permease n=1 Tax=unclassified Bosea (in: a-proteobacteria) TaxID=2653178 RepID=UPI000F760F18|nr:MULTISPECIES: ABC transporter permease subunit [unclassified Bosea (in: a-proteobacteria)]AZO81737.1 amino acid ABC transporter permease [Bosea sp. Tri-49]